jgi:hypothetical protein
VSIDPGQLRTLIVRPALQAIRLCPGRRPLLGLTGGKHAVETRDIAGASRIVLKA